MGPLTTGDIRAVTALGTMVTGFARELDAIARPTAKDPKVFVSAQKADELSHAWDGMSPAIGAVGGDDILEVRAFLRLAGDLATNQQHARTAVGFAADHALSIGSRITKELADQPGIAAALDARAEMFGKRVYSPEGVLAAANKLTT